MHLPERSRRSRPDGKLLRHRTTPRSLDGAMARPPVRTARLRKTQPWTRARDAGWSGVGGLEVEDLEDLDLENDLVDSEGELEGRVGGASKGG